jgi:hypothetical protein
MQQLTYCPLPYVSSPIRAAPVLSGFEIGGAVPRGAVFVAVAQVIVLDDA